MAGPFGHALHGLTQGLAQGTMMGMRMSELSKDREAQAAKEKAAEADRKLANTGKGLELMLKFSDETLPPELKQFGYSQAMQLMDIDPDSDSAKTFVKLISKSPELGTALADLVDQRFLSATDKPPHERLQIASQFAKQLMGSPGEMAKFLADLYPGEEDAAENSQLFAVTDENNTQRVTQVEKGPDGPRIVGSVNTGNVRAPAPPNSFVFSQGPNGGLQLASGPDAGNQIRSLQDAEEARKFMGRQDGLRSMVRMREVLNTTLKNSNNPNGLLGLMGTTTRFLDTARAQATAAVRAVNGDPGEVERLLDPSKYNLSWADKIAGNAANAQRIKGNIIGLAYAYLNANESGGRFTENDMNRALDRIGGRSGSMEQLMAGIDDALVSSHDDLKDMAISRKWATEENWKSMLPADINRGASGAVPVPANLANEPDGTVVSDGKQQYTKRGNQLIPVR